jgi:hypothetical protein
MNANGYFTMLDEGEQDEGIKERSPGHFAIILDASGKRRRKWHSFEGTKR